MAAIEQAKADLLEKGYAIIPNVLNREEVDTALSYFREWLHENPICVKLHRKIDPHGIFKYAEIGHQKHAWYVKTREAVQAPFQAIWGTPHLTTGYDGSCWIPAEQMTKDKIWTHTDQAANTKGFACVQGFVALTSNSQRTLVVYEGSHLLHEKYMAEYGITGTKNWALIDHGYLASIADRKRVLTVAAGSLVLWDSRTFHQNQYGQPGEERMVQYVCYLPKNHVSNTAVMRSKRLKYFHERRTTSHWPYPLQVNGKQPQNYGDKTLVLDYTSLKVPDLGNLTEACMRLIK